MRGHEGKVAVVTGAARGIGQAYAQRLAEDGCELVLVDLNDCDETAAAIRATGRRVLTHQCNVTVPEEVETLASAVEQELGRCDILINNAGVILVRNFEDTTFEDWKASFAVNLDSYFLMCRAFVPGMRQNGWGRIVMASTAATNMVIKGFTAYLGTKGGVVGFTRALASELAPDGVTVNAVAPSLTRTPATTGRSHGPGGMTQDEEFQIVANLQAIKRTEEPSDLVGAVSFLTSDESAFITGQVYYVDGGLIRTG